MEQTEHAIRKCAHAHQDNIKCRWVYVPTCKVDTNGPVCDMDTGTLFYDHPAYEIGPAIRMQQWVFLLEHLNISFAAKISPARAEEISEMPWMATAFHGNSHYNFGPYNEEVKGDIRERFFREATYRFMPFVFPALFEAGEDHVAKIKTWNMRLAPVTDAGELKKLQEEKILEGGNVM